MTKPDQKSLVRPLKIGFVLSRSFTLSAFAMFVDTLRLASDEADRSGRRFADWQVMASTRHLIASSCGVQIAPTSGFIEPRELDYVVVVGGLLSVAEPVDHETQQYLKRVAAAKVPLIGLCTGTFILAEAGLMKKHQTCVSWLHYEAFRERFPDIPVRADRIYNLDRDRGSCAGGSSSADMAATIVRRHISPEAERNALEVLQIEKARSPLDIQPRKPLSIDCDEPRVRAALIMMERNLENALTIPKLAASVGMSRRQLERIFKETTQSSPAVIYKRLRLERAKELLLRSKAPLIEIATQVGFDNPSHFARIFRSTYGHAPSRFRNGSRAKAQAQGRQS